MKRWARVTLKILGGLLLGVVTLAAAWAAFNNRLVDDAARPVPEALRVPASTLPAKDNAMFGLLGLEAAGEDPHTEGLPAWARIEAGRFDEIPPLPRSWPSSSGDKSARAWQCDAQTQDCVAVWTREEDGLRWIQTEANFGREAVREMACSDLGADPARIAPDDPLHCVPQIWAMPHATQHLLDEQWLRARTLADGGILALLAWDPDLMAARPWGLPVWRNSIGHMLVAVGSPGFTLYVRKQASLLLLNEAARLALAAGDVEPSKRAAWLTQQPMDARLRERLAIDGDHVVARVWEPVSSQDTLRYRIPHGATSAATVTGSHPDPSPSKS